MRYFLWIFGTLFALAAIPAVFYFVLFLLRGDDILRVRALKFYRWALVIFLFTFNVAIYGHIVIALLQLWGFMR